MDLALYRDGRLLVRCEVKERASLTPGPLLIGLALEASDMTSLLAAIARRGSTRLLRARHG